MAGYSSGVFTRSDGVRSGASVCQDQKAAAVKVTSSLMDAELNYIKGALDTCVLKDGTQTITANIPMSTFKFTGLGSGTARTDSASIANVQDSAVLWGGTSGGSANAQTITLSPAITAYVAGQMFSFIAGFTQTSSCTLNVNSVGAKNIKLMGGLGTLVNPIQATIIVGGLYTVIYDGTQFILLNPSEQMRYITTVSAAGTDQSTATAFDAQFVHVSGGTGGLKLPASTPGRSIFIYNITSAYIKIYPPTSSAIGAQAANSPVYVAPYSASTFFCYSTTAWDHVSGIPEQWATWSPSYSATGSMTFTSVTTFYAKYQVVGKTCYFAISALGNVGGTASTSLKFTVPVAMSATGAFGGGCAAQDNSAWKGGFYQAFDTSTAQVSRYDGASFTVGGVQGGFQVSGTYEIA